MKIHLIAVGGSVMHNFALALDGLGYSVTGSDDQIYDPARNRLAKAGLLPKRDGWNPELITPDLDAVIVGMHARKDNPELLKAQNLGLPIFSFPEFFAQHITGKTRVAVAGSHGKTTTTAMILHVTSASGVNADHLVGAQLPGFETMVRLSDAPIAIMEADEYLSSPLDPRPKFLHYRPTITVVTGIAWDHINVFPTEESYCNAFKDYLTSLPDQAIVFFDDSDPILSNLVSGFSKVIARPYRAFPHRVDHGRIVLEGPKGALYPCQIIGAHNMRNLMAAWLVCEQLGISMDDFLRAISTFRGAAQRLQLLGTTPDTDRLYLDFAHAPSKVKATVDSLKTQFNHQRLAACLELHTFSSLNRNYLSQYAGSLDSADAACVFFSPETLLHKKLPALESADIHSAFSKPGLQVFTNADDLEGWMRAQHTAGGNLLVMSSGRLGGFDIGAFSRSLYPGE